MILYSFVAIVMFGDNSESGESLIFDPYISYTTEICELKYKYNYIGSLFACRQGIRYLNSKDSGVSITIIVSISIKILYHLIRFWVGLV